MDNKAIENIGKYLQDLSESLKSEMENLKLDIGNAVLNNLSEDRIRDLKEMYLRFTGESRLIDRLFRGFPELKQKQITNNEHSTKGNN